MIVWLISRNCRVEQKDSLYFGSCKKLVTTSGPSSHLTSVVGGQPTYCDCTSDMQTCAPGRDVVNCVSSTSTGRGGHLPGILLSYFNAIHGAIIISLSTLTTFLIVHCVSHEFSSPSTLRYPQSFHCSYHPLS